MTGVQTCALPISHSTRSAPPAPNEPTAPTSFHPSSSACVKPTSFPPNVPLGVLTPKYSPTIASPTNCAGGRKTTAARFCSAASGRVHAARVEKRQRAARADSLLELEGPEDETGGEDRRKLGLGEGGSLERRASMEALSVSSSGSEEEEESRGECECGGVGGFILEGEAARSLETTRRGALGAGDSVRWCSTVRAKAQLYSSAWLRSVRRAREARGKAEPVQADWSTIFACVAPEDCGSGLSASLQAVWRSPSQTALFMHKDASNSRRCLCQRSA